MSDLDLEPLLRDSPEGVLRDVLESALADGPRSGARERTLIALDLAPPPTDTARSASLWRTLDGRHLAGIGLALTVGVSVIAVVSTSESRSEHAAATGSHDAVPLVTIAATDESLTIPTFELPPPMPTSEKPSSLHAAPARRERESAAKPSARPTVQILRNRPVTEAPSAVAAPLASSPAESTLRRELARVGAARSALLAGEAPRTLQLLDQYEAEFPAGAFSVEVSVLRIEALARSGRSDEARRLGDRFLARHPEAAFARRVSAILGRIAPPTQEAAPGSPRD